jgi:hypothetical protein
LDTNWDVYLDIIHMDKRLGAWHRGALEIQLVYIDNILV